MPLVVAGVCIRMQDQDTGNQSTTSRTTLDRALIWELSAECNRNQDRSRRVFGVPLPAKVGVTIGVLKEELGQTEALSVTELLIKANLT